MKSIKFLTLSLILASFSVCQSSTPKDTFVYSALVRFNYQAISNMHKNMADYPFLAEIDKNCALATANFYQALQAAKTDAEANATIDNYAAIQITCFFDQHRPEKIRERETKIKEMIREEDQQQ
ncbi:MAG: hypothetical protein ACXWL2_03835 [Candidatus Chromulinivorax sp.]